MKEKSIKNEWPTGSTSDIATKFTQIMNGRRFLSKKSMFTQRKAETRVANLREGIFHDSLHLASRRSYLSRQWLYVLPALDAAKIRQAIPQTRHIRKPKYQNLSTWKPAGGWTNGLHNTLRNTVVTCQVAFQINFDTPCTVAKHAAFGRAAVISRWRIGTYVRTHGTGHRPTTVARQAGLSYQNEFGETVLNIS